MKVRSPLLRRVHPLFAICSFGLVLQAQQTAPATLRGIMVTDIDRSVKPGDNFFHYSNGAWIKRVAIPPDRAAVSAFTTLTQNANDRTAALIQEIAASPDKATPATRKIADLYRSYMDEATIERQGLTPLKTEFDRINAIRDKRDFARFLGEQLRADEDPLNMTNFHSPNFLGLWVAPGFSDSGHYMPYLLQGGLEMPDREYYLKSGEHMEGIRTRYRAHVIAMLKLAGVSSADQRTEGIIALEHAIAEKHWTLADDQDVHKANNLWRKSDFASKAPDSLGMSSLALRI
jgi:putative endopeptidase